MKLNLTNEMRGSVRVTFSVNKFVASCDGALIGAYISKQAMRDEFKENGIVNAQFDGIAQRMYLANYGN